jgi:acetoin utilization deacetylase AcuC-like enzyme
MAGSRISPKMKVVFSEIFYPGYADNIAADDGRMEAIVRVIANTVDFFEADYAPEADISAVHDPEHVERIKRKKLYTISSLAAGGAIQTARIGLTEPAFGLIRPPGHHASVNSSLGFCYFNNMAIAMMKLKKEGLIENCFILDIDLHYGDGTVDILGDYDWTAIYNPASIIRRKYLEDVKRVMSRVNVDIIGVSAGFDAHIKDWNGFLETEDYRKIGKWVSQAARRSGSGCFGILEGGYNKKVLGYNVEAFLEGLALY